MSRARESWRCNECGCTDGRQSIGPQGIHDACPAPDGPGCFVWWYEGDDYVECVRAGNVDCLLCESPYSKHPYAYGPAAVAYDGQPFLHRLCDGTLVKL